MPIITVDITKTNHFTLSRLTLFISQIRVPTRIVLSADYFAQPLFNNSTVSWTATRAISKKGDDLSYGTPVPGKTGFVTSPFSPNAGYIDVRGFAPGTPVKDPYTGKIFLTP